MGGGPNLAPADVLNLSLKYRQSLFASLAALFVERIGLPEQCRIILRVPVMDIV
jgi:hypothetical protein